MNTKDIKTVKMFGPSISDPSKIVNRDIPEADVQAYKASGYQLGSTNEIPAEIPEPVVEKEFATVGKTYTEAEAKAHISTKAKGKGK